MYRTISKTPNFMLKYELHAYAYENSDIPSRWFFFHYEFPLMDWFQKKNTLTVTSHIPLFFGGVFLQNVRVFEARKMEWRMDFFC